MNRKMIVGAAICAASILGAGAGAADAGEVTGNGKAKVVKANSECAFSGLEDNDGLEPVVPGVTQNWGQIPKEVRDILRSEGISPEELCNGHKNPLHVD